MVVSTAMESAFGRSRLTINSRPSRNLLDLPAELILMVIHEAAVENITDAFHIVHCFRIIIDMWDTKRQNHMSTMLRRVVGKAVLPAADFSIWTYIVIKDLKRRMRMVGHRRGAAM